MENNFWNNLNIDTTQVKQEIADLEKRLKDLDEQITKEKKIKITLDAQTLEAMKGGKEGAKPVEDMSKQAENAYAKACDSVRLYTDILEKNVKKQKELINEAAKGLNYKNENIVSNTFKQYQDSLTKYTTLLDKAIEIVNQKRKELIDKGGNQNLIAPQLTANANLAVIKSECEFLNKEFEILVKVKRAQNEFNAVKKEYQNVQTKKEQINIESKLQTNISQLKTYYAELEKIGKGYKTPSTLQIIDTYKSNINAQISGAQQLINNNNKQISSTQIFVNTLKELRDALSAVKVFAKDPLINEQALKASIISIENLKNKISELRKEGEIRKNKPLYRDAGKAISEVNTALHGIETAKVQKELSIQKDKEQELLNIEKNKQAKIMAEVKAEIAMEKTIQAELKKLATEKEKARQALLDISKAEIDYKQEKRASRDQREKSLLTEPNKADIDKYKKILLEIDREANVLLRDIQNLQKGSGEWQTAVEGLNKYKNAALSVINVLEKTYGLTQKEAFKKFEKMIPEKMGTDYNILLEKSKVQQNKINEEALKDRLKLLDQEHSKEVDKLALLDKETQAWKEQLLIVERYKKEILSLSASKDINKANANFAMRNKYEKLDYSQIGIDRDKENLKIQQSITSEIKDRITEYRKLDQIAKGTKDPNLLDRIKLNAKETEAQINKLIDKLINLDAKYKNNINVLSAQHITSMPFGEGKTAKIISPSEIFEKEMKQTIASYNQLVAAGKKIRMNEGVDSNNYKDAGDKADILRQKMQDLNQQLLRYAPNSASIVRANALLGQSFNEATEKNLNFIAQLSRIKTVMFTAMMAYFNLQQAMMNLKTVYIDQIDALRKLELGQAGAFNNIYVESFNDSLQRSKSFMRDLIADSVKLNINFQTLQETANATLPLLLSKGFNEEQSRTIITRMTKGAQILFPTMAGFQAQSEIRALLGQSPLNRAQIVQSLGISSTGQLKSLLAKGPEAFTEEIVKRSKGYALAGEESQKLVSTQIEKLKTQILLLSESIGTKLYESVVKLLQYINEGLEKKKFDNIINAIKSIGDGLAVFVDLITNTGIPAINSLAGVFPSLIAAITLASFKIKEIALSVQNVANMDLATIGSGMRNTKAISSTEKVSESLMFSDTGQKASLALGKNTTAMQKVSDSISKIGNSLPLIGAAIITLTEAFTLWTNTQQKEKMLDDRLQTYEQTNESYKTFTSRFSKFSRMSEEELNQRSYGEKLNFSKAYKAVKSQLEKQIEIDTQSLSTVQGEEKIQLNDQIKQTRNKLKYLEDKFGLAANLKSFSEQLEEAKTTVTPMGLYERFQKQMPNWNADIEKYKNDIPSLETKFNAIQSKNKIDNVASIYKKEQGIINKFTEQDIKMLNNKVQKSLPFSFADATEMQKKIPSNIDINAFDTNAAKKVLDFYNQHLKLAQEAKSKIDKQTQAENELNNALIARTSVVSDKTQSTTLIVDSMFEDLKKQLSQTKDSNKKMELLNQQYELLNMGKANVTKDLDAAAVNQYEEELKRAGKSDKAQIIKDKEKKIAQYKKDQYRDSVDLKNIEDKQYEASQALESLAVSEITRLANRKKQVLEIIRNRKFVTEDTKKSDQIMLGRINEEITTVQNKYTGSTSGALSSDLQNSFQEILKNNAELNDNWLYITEDTKKLTQNIKSFLEKITTTLENSLAAIDTNIENKLLNLEVAKSKYNITNPKAQAYLEQQGALYQTQGNRSKLNLTGNALSDVRDRLTGMAKMSPEEINKRGMQAYNDDLAKLSEEEIKLTQLYEKQNQELIKSNAIYTQRTYTLNELKLATQDTNKQFEIELQLMIDTQAAQQRMTQYDNLLKNAQTNFQLGNISTEELAITEEIINLEKNRFQVESELNAVELQTTSEKIKLERDLAQAKLNTAQAQLVLNQAQASGNPENIKAAQDALNAILIQRQDVENSMIQIVTKAEEQKNGIREKGLQEELRIETDYNNKKLIEDKQYWDRKFAQDEQELKNIIAQQEAQKKASMHMEFSSDFSAGGYLDIIQQANLKQMAGIKDENPALTDYANRKYNEMNTVSGNLGNEALINRMQEFMKQNKNAQGEYTMETELEINKMKISEYIKALQDKGIQPFQTQISKFTSALGGANTLDDIAVATNALNVLNNNFQEINKAATKYGLDVSSLAESMADLATQINEKRIEIEKRIYEANQKIKQEITTLAQPTTTEISGFKTGVSIASDLRSLLESGVSEQLVRDLLSLRIKELVDQNNEALQAIKDKINKGYENKRGELISLSAGLKIDIDNVIKEAKKNLNNIRNSYNETALEIINADRDVATIRPEEERRQQLIKLAKKQKMEESTITTDRDDAIAKLNNEFNREIENLYKEQNNLILALQAAFRAITMVANEAFTGFTQSNAISNNSVITNISKATTPIAAPQEPALINTGTKATSGGSSININPSISQTSRINVNDNTEAENMTSGGSVPDTGDLGGGGIDLGSAAQDQAAHDARKKKKKSPTPSPSKTPTPAPGGGVGESKTSGGGGPKKKTVYGKWLGSGGKYRYGTHEEYMKSHYGDAGWIKVSKEEYDKQKAKESKNNTSPGTALGSSDGSNSGIAGGLNLPKATTAGGNSGLIGSGVGSLMGSGSGDVLGSAIGNKLGNADLFPSPKPVSVGGGEGANNQVNVNINDNNGMNPDQIGGLVKKEIQNYNETKRMK